METPTSAAAVADFKEKISAFISECGVTTPAEQSLVALLSIELCAMAKNARFAWESIGVPRAEARKLAQVAVATSLKGMELGAEIEDSRSRAEVTDAR